MNNSLYSIVVLVLFSLALPSWAFNTKLFVHANTLNVRSSPDIQANIIGQLFIGSQVIVKKEDNTQRWAFINSEGINGWVDRSYIKNTPISPESHKKIKNKLILHIIKNSDDYQHFKHIFRRVSLKLIHSQTCTFSDIQKMSGWWKDVKNPNNYYLYCTINGKKTKITLNTEQENLTFED